MPAKKFPWQVLIESVFVWKELGLRWLFVKGGPVFCGFRSCVVLADPSPPSHLLEIIQGSCSHAIQEPTIDRDQLCLLRMTPTAAQVSPLKVFDVLLVVPFGCMSVPFGCMSGLIITVLVVQAPTPEKKKKKKKKMYYSRLFRWIKTDSRRVLPLGSTFSG